ncbi:hypothetical protein HanPSC8_Chr08g0322121 [Helianthus annuus]|nr:hypothetical protein HanLR1_Chr08g0274481 [Helianthus annuus]KAJ0901162.1 hypothetical protein HanPSC8_Chr08g0322121 [Helianthus annuus]
MFGQVRDLLYRDYQGDHKFTITTYSSTRIHVTTCDCFCRGSIGKEEVDTLMILTTGSRLEGESLAMCILLGKRGLVYQTFIQSKLQCLSFNVFSFRNLSANNVCIISC